MKLVEYVRFLRRHARLIVLVVLVCTGASLGLALRQTPVHQTSAHLVVANFTSVTAADEVARRQLAIERALS